METPFSIRYGCGVTAGLRDALDTDGVVLCMAVQHFRTPVVPMVAAACGFDAVYVDLEHTALPLDAAADLCSAAVSAGIVALVRVSGHDASGIGRALDVGATGVIVPHIESARQAADVVAAAHFPPTGRRSVSGPTAATGYGHRSVAEVMVAARAFTSVTVMVESRAGLFAVDEIAAVPGVDMILLGANDLSLDLGVHEDFASDVFDEAVSRVADACREHGPAFGVAGVPAVDLLRRYVDRGLRFVSAGTDLGFMTVAAGDRVRTLRALDEAGTTRMTATR